MADELVGKLVPILKDIGNTRYSELASSTIIVFDYLLTLSQEIQYIWKARWTIGKVLFFLNRYYTLFVVALNNYALFAPSLTDDLYVTQQCSQVESNCLIAVSLRWFQWQGWTGLISAALAEAVLQLRLYALYYGKKKVLVLMVGFYIAAMAASAVIMGTTLRNVDARSNSIPGTTFCIPNDVSGHFYAFWIPILGFEAFLCFLACIRGIKSYRDREIGPVVLRRGRQSQQPQRALNILEILLRDSVGYFIVIFATYLTTTLMWIFGPITVIEIPVGFTVALSSVIANRLLLNLRNTQKNVSANAPNQNMSSQSLRHGTSIIDLGSAIEERGREVPGYELEVLRGLKVSPR